MKNGFALQSMSYNAAFADQAKWNMTGIKAQFNAVIADCTKAFNTLLRCC